MFSGVDKPVHLKIYFNLTNNPLHDPARLVSLRKVQTPAEAVWIIRDFEHCPES